MGNTHKTAFSKKCEILGSFWILYRDNMEDSGWDDFFEQSDVGLPLAYMVWQDVARPSVSGKKFVLETWESYCGLLGIDMDGSYDSMIQTFESSPNYVAPAA